ncbi:MAG: GNAT family N-acetyltransferase [Halobacteriales archaeon]|nr:GNAT family N-acetyltransferase [Halobacteriales archaeon]
MNGEDGVTDVLEFPTPPFEFDTKEDRTVEVREYDGDREALRRMYEEFDPADRAQGIPPVREDALERWLDTVLEGVNVVAFCDDEAVGHATLVEEERMDAHELAIFVLQRYQGEGVGSNLMRGTLTLAYERGVRDVWLTVERWNHAAIRLYKKTGFEVTMQESFEIEMATRLVKRKKS